MPSRGTGMARVARVAGSGAAKDSKLAMWLGVYD